MNREAPIYWRRLKEGMVNTELVFIRFDGKGDPKPALMLSPGRATVAKDRRYLIFLDDLNMYKWVPEMGKTPDEVKELQHWVFRRIAEICKMFCIGSVSVTEMSKIHEQVVEGIEELIDMPVWEMVHDKVGISPPSPQGELKVSLGGRTILHGEYDADGKVTK